MQPPLLRSTRACSAVSAGCDTLQPAQLHFLDACGVADLRRYACFANRAAYIRVAGAPLPYLLHVASPHMVLHQQASFSMQHGRAM